MMVNALTGFVTGNGFDFSATISASTNNYNVKTAAISAGWDQVAPLSAVITINPGVVIGSTSVSTAALDSGTSIPAGSTLSIINNGTIKGKGGDGKACRWVSASSGYWAANGGGIVTGYNYFDSSLISLNTSLGSSRYGCSVRLCRSSQDSHSFSTSATSAIQFANGNVQYHCTQHKWRFAEHQYDYIGADNANISDSYNGWIDLFGYGTSGVNYSPTEHSTDNSKYASGDITNTDNDWGINEIESYEYNVAKNQFKKVGVVKSDTLEEGAKMAIEQSKIVTTELIED